MNNIEATIKIPPTTSAEMRNVTLSNETKELLVAHRMMQEVGDHVSEHMKKVWGEHSIDRVMKAFWASIGQTQGGNNKSYG